MPRHKEAIRTRLTVRVASLDSFCKWIACAGQVDIGSGCQNKGYSRRVCGASCCPHACDGVLSVEQGLPRIAAVVLNVRAHHASANCDRDGFSNLFRTRTVARLEIGGDRKWTCRSNGPDAIQHGLPAHSSFLIREAQRESHACTRSGNGRKAAGGEYQRTTNVLSIGHQKDGVGGVQLLKPLTPLDLVHDDHPSGC